MKNTCIFSRSSSVLSQFSLLKCVGVTMKLFRVMFLSASLAWMPLMVLWNSIFFVGGAGVLEAVWFDEGDLLLVVLYAPE